MKIHKYLFFRTQVRITVNKYVYTHIKHSLIELVFFIKN